MLSIQVRGVEVAKVPNTPQYLKFHTPEKRDLEWKIVDEESGEVVAAYKPPRPKRQTPCTRYEGSWAATVNNATA